MKRKTLLLCLPLFMTGTALAETNDYQLDQVLVMSRHNLRAPLANNGSVLAQSTPKVWPAWDTPGGLLTTKGGVLEVYMGHYFNAWLKQTGVLPQEGCPTAGSVYVYANSLQRTVATAQFFTNGAFPGCDVSVHHQDKMGEMDPTFNPIITDNSEAFNQQALGAMNAELASLKLDASYKQLEKIIDYKDSSACKTDKHCDLTKEASKMSAVPGKEPGVAGPLRVGNSLVDAFMLQYYEGFPMKDVAWGKITTPQQWKQLAQLKDGYQDSLFTSPVVAQNVAKPLLTYINGALIGERKPDSPKVTVLVGHDSNIASLLSAMEFKPYQLPHQYEKTPIGGKLVFQRWHDKKNDRDLLKIEYVYQSTDQLRNATPLTLKTPPQRVTMALKGCPIDKQGYCAWSDFEKTMKGIL
ncbi:bifunctional glucose-1-phosphatase/inositol phosphatase [Serratia liquefaciens]|uniref:bifunctional glucose-1-phosphatase/inositol phosphatase n=1 Tax=Serratia liquefaciens TaxID=614 RepID=UPI000E06B950|nr:bifunctional glucose-1-phosphatase/inositol phosphatase [Serratia liquefaciens]RYM85240.1 bifunctional glucose-1-phosphatase/inositol phosphatase [Serratia liquefaciens]CAI1543538.1 Glucose-1-phosphatase precursor [Serratia liquefaciens]SUI48138.1 Glucose-1-phosphatase precursor [Serratia liquefaciens]HDS8358869.1 bifunctional glucose-1-phosphatase/inositol phosphatase [Serratia liquefaciens]